MVATPTYNPVNFFDPTGESVLTAFLLSAFSGAIVGGIIGGTLACGSAISSGLENAELLLYAAEAVAKGVLIGGLAGGLAAATAGAVSVFGATSVAGTAAIFATAIVAAKATEVAALQAKKSISDGDNGWQVAGDCLDSVFSNGEKFVLSVATKGVTTVGTYILANSTKHKLAPILFNTFLYSKANQVLAYGSVTYTWCETVYSISCVDPIARANQRGYSLK